MQFHEDSIEQILERERNQSLEQLERWLEIPMIVLGFGWLALLIVEFTWGLSRFLEVTTRLIWLAFIVEFALRFTLAPRKIPFLRKSWLTIIALLIPALRVFRISRDQIVAAGASCARPPIVADRNLDKSRHARSRHGDGAARVALRHCPHRHRDSRRSRWHVRI